MNYSIFCKIVTSKEKAYRNLSLRVIDIEGIDLYILRLSMLILSS